MVDAAKEIEKYVDSNGNDISHIYSYNKIMSLDDRRSISEILNRTNFRLMAWYFGPNDSASSGLKRVRLAFKMPMQSTGNEKFTVYCYFKTELYDPLKPWSDSESECDETKLSGDKESSDSSSEQSDTNINPEESALTNKRIQKQQIKKELST